MNQLVEKYKIVRSRTEEICKPLNTEDYVPQVAEHASPARWQLGHTSWFFEEMVLKNNQREYKIFHPNFAFLFNSYYETLGDRTLRAERGDLTRPTVEEVYKYRRYVDEAMGKFLGEQEISEELHDIILLGLNHEQQHQELLITDLKYMFGLNPTFPVYHPEANLLKDHNVDLGWAKITEGVYEIGYSGTDFCFDNERGKHKVYLHDFEISKSLVTCGEYLEFINDGGYEKFHFWLDEGWKWVQENRVKSPKYWTLIEGKWKVFTLAGLKDVDEKAILGHVSFYEANAFARWKGMRLPTEFEWEAACEQFTWGKRWEWTNSAYLPYPGFDISEGAVGEYNGKFMINQMVLRGASVATAKDHSRKTYRNFFHPHYQWQYSGIRLAR